MRRIAVFTGTRADYGLLYWLMRDIQAHPDLELRVIAGAMHWAPEFGSTGQQLIEDGFAIDARIEMLLASDSAAGIAKSMGLGTIGMAEALERLAPDALVVLGDRFEALAAAQAALVARVPIVHLHGGERTDGAYDDAIRHAITKMASLHCVAAEPYRRRVIQLGEAPERVLTVGAMGLDQLHRAPRLDRQALARSLDFALDDPYLLVTYHPVTLGEEPPVASFRALLAALEQWPDHRLILTYPNADNGGRALIAELEAYAAARPERVLAMPSLGSHRYPSVLAGAAAVVGNSSSGLIEAPSLGVPTVNVGCRQQGRLAADSVLHCAASTDAIAGALKQALTPAFAEHCRSVSNPYGQGDASAAVVAALAGRELTAGKTFYDLPGETS